MNLSDLDKIALRQYTSLEKQCVYQVVCAAMICDGEKDYRETQLVEKIVLAIGLSQQERESSRRLDEPTMVKVIRGMDDLKRIYVGKLIAQMILADGKVTQREQMFSQYIFDRLNIPAI